MFCGDGSRVDRMLDRVEELVKPTEAQKAVFADFKTAAKVAAEKVKSTCPIEAPRNIPERFGMAEKRLEAALDAVRTVRPAADKLYAALTVLADPLRFVLIGHADCTQMSRRPR
jgi:hypothetical protein